MTRARDLAAFVSNADGDIKFDTDTLFIDSSANRVGIGTDTPDTILELKGADPILTIRDSATSSGAANATLRLAETGASDALDQYFDIKANNGQLEIIDNWNEGGGTGTRVVINDRGNVGIGVVPKTGGSTWQHVQFGGTGNIIARHSDSNVDAIFSNNYYVNSSGTDSYIATGDAARMFFNDDVITFSNAGSGSADAAISWNERMRIDSSGNLLVGKTAQNHTDVGHTLYPSGGISVVRSGGQCAVLNRTSSDGTIIDFRKDNTTCGSIDSRNGNAIVISTNNGSGINFGSSSLNPWYQGAITDNTTDLGQSAHRYDDIFATNATIQTSDENEKQQIASLTDAEITAATAISKLFKTYKWNDKVEAKGDAARTHTGVVAQQVEQAMTDAGLTASNYAFWCSDTWWETQTEVAAVEADEENGIEAQEAYTRTDTYYTAEEAPEGATERNRKGIRYPELLAFIGAATEQRLTSIEARLDALEA